MLDKLKRLITGQSGASEATGGSQKAVVTVVSGLPRSGTSMMMQMLDEGGIPPLTDEQRAPDEDNPKGYYEFERVKKLDKGDKAWVDQAQGKAVKVISALLRHLPPGYEYRVLFMRRHLDEVLASQRKMLERRGEDPDAATDEELRDLFLKHIDHVQSWAAQNDNVHLLEVSYNDILDAPREPLGEVAAFLGGRVDVEAMLGVLDPSLYRNRAEDAG